MNWYEYAWRNGSTASSSALSEQAPLDTKTATSWYEYGWRAGLVADLKPSDASDSHSRPDVKRIMSGLRHAVGRVLSWLDGSDEPHVWSTVNPAGQVRWNANDPYSGRQIRDVSENALRVWLEERHYNT